MVIWNEDFTWTQCSSVEMGKLIEKKKNLRDKFFVCAPACARVFYNLKVPHVVSWIYILMVNFISPMLILSLYHISLVQVWFCKMNHEFYAIGVYKHNLSCI